MKKIVLVALALLSTNILLAFAQEQNGWSITIGEDWSSGKNYDPANYGRMLRGTQTDNPTNEENPPLTPATLLLLGLGGATVGGAVYRNSKRKK
ncbi:MAG: hypothetical protein IKV46_03130 [Bacteroidales bacterium]|nr:hypothetical protein [Bacteroidales bacterium]